MGDIETVGFRYGMSFDQAGKELVVRRIRIDLHQPTRDGETRLYLLTNLREEDADAPTAALMYCERLAD